MRIVKSNLTCTTGRKSKSAKNGISEKAETKGRALSLMVTDGGGHLGKRGVSGRIGSKRKG